MQQVTLQSRRLESAAYNEDSQILHIWLKSRRHLQFSGIPRHVYENLISAPSPDLYYSYYIAEERKPARKRRFWPIATLTAGLCMTFAIWHYYPLLLRAFSN